jgi:hypothetical protein
MLEGPQTWHGDLIPQRVDALGLRRSLDWLNLLEVQTHFGQNYQQLKKKEEEQLSLTGHQTLLMVLVLHL